MSTIGATAALLAASQDRSKNVVRNEKGFSQKLGQNNYPRKLFTGIAFTPTQCTDMCVYRTKIADDMSIKLVYFLELSHSSKLSNVLLY